MLSFPSFFMLDAWLTSGPGPRPQRYIDREIPRNMVGNNGATEERE